MELDFSCVCFLGLYYNRSRSKEKHIPLQIEFYIERALKNLLYPVGLLKQMDDTERL